MMKEHYDKLGWASASLSKQQALAARGSGPAASIKAFHNHVKRQLLLAFAQGASSLLDLCCGRGGDLLKWSAARLQYVKAVDFSEMELQEARRRYADMRRSSSATAAPSAVAAIPHVDFVHNDDLGSCVFVDVQRGQGYDAVTCMFALHYFFKSADTLRTFLTNVSVNLAPGGYFFGIVPDGKRVLDLSRSLGGHQTTRPSGLLSLSLCRDEDEGGVASGGEFGQQCIFRIHDTVTDLEGAGSREYLVDEATLVGVAAEFGLRPVTGEYPPPAAGARGGDWRCALEPPASKTQLFRALNGRTWYRGTDACSSSSLPGVVDELCTISSLFCVFAFVKDDAPW